MVVFIYCNSLSHTLQLLIMGANFHDEIQKYYIACLTSLCRFPCTMWYCFVHVMYIIKRLLYSCISIADSLSIKTFLQRMIAEVLMHSTNVGNPCHLDLMSPQDVATKLDNILNKDHCMCMKYKFLITMYIKNAHTCSYRFVSYM